MDNFEARLADLQPSQLYICSEKLAQVERDAGGEPGVEPEPLPVTDIGVGPGLVLTDGHTRAFATWCRGDTTVLVCWETDSLDWDAYRVCVEWCLEAGVRTVADLAERVVSADEYEGLWIDRCSVLHQDLARKLRGPDR